MSTVKREVRIGVYWVDMRQTSVYYDKTINIGVHYGESIKDWCTLW